MSKYSVELERAQNDSRSKEVSALNSQIRAIGLNNLQNGDIVTIPAGYKVFEQEISGSDATAQYIVVNVQRGSEETALRFYPSSFTKMGTSVNEDYTRGEFIHATGTVVDEVQQYADMNEAVKAIVGKPFKATLTPCSIVTFEARDKDILTKNDVRKTSMPQYDFV